MARDGLRRQVIQDVSLRCPDAHKESAATCWLRVGSVALAALFVLVSARRGAQRSRVALAARWPRVGAGCV